jgi:hypothetical protein
MRVLVDRACATCAARVDAIDTSHLLVLVIDTLVVLSIMVTMGVRNVGGVAGLEFALLGAAAGGARPGKATAWLFQQGWLDAVHVIRVLTDGTVHRIIAV